MGTLILLDHDELRPGENSYAQIRLDRPVVAKRGDRFVLRSYSPMHTIGGGQILHPTPDKRKRKVASTLESLAILEEGDPTEILQLHLKDAGEVGIGANDLGIRANLPDKQLYGLLQDLKSQGEVIQFDREPDRYVHSNVMNNLIQLLRERLEDFHRREPLKSGMNKEELSARIPGRVDTKLFNEIVQRLVRQGDIIQEKEVIRLSSHQVALAVDQEKTRREIETIYREADLQPPFFREAAKTLGVPETEARSILSWMLEKGLLVKVKEDMYFHEASLEDLKRRLLDFFSAHEEITTAEFKELTQTSRKYTIPLLEFLDANRFTIRVGDVRRLRKAGSG